MTPGLYTATQLLCPCLGPCYSLSGMFFSRSCRLAPFHHSSFSAEMLLPQRPFLTDLMYILTSTIPFLIPLPCYWLYSTDHYLNVFYLTLLALVLAMVMWKGKSLHYFLGETGKVRYNHVVEGLEFPLRGFIWFASFPGAKKCLK